MVKRKLVLHYIKEGKEFICRYCRDKLTCVKVEGDSLPNNYLTLEHIKPINDFVTCYGEHRRLRQLMNHPCNDIENLDVCCLACNRTQGLLMTYSVQKRISEQEEDK